MNAITELERLGMTRLNRTMNRRLVSMSQILDKVLSVLATHKPDTDVKPSSLLSPSGERRLRRRDIAASRVRKMLGLPVDHASPRSSPSLVSPEPSVKLSGSSPREVTDKATESGNEMQPLLPVPTSIRESSTIRKSGEESSETPQRCLKRQPCALCLHVFPLESLPSSSTVGEIERMRKVWGERQRKRMAGERTSQHGSSSVIEGIRFQMKTEKKLAELGMGIEVLEAVKSEETRRFHPPADRPYSSGMFQVMAVRKPICVLCHNILGREYEISGHWEKEGSSIDPPPKPKWLRLHGLDTDKNKEATAKKCSTRSRRREDPAEWLQMKELGIYEDEGDSPNEEGADSGLEGESHSDGEADQHVSEEQMRQDLETLLREQKMMLEELRELELARQEVKERKRIVHEKRRNRLRKMAQSDARRHLAFFSGRG